MTGWLVGWHYTVGKFWGSINRRGLVPQPLDKPELASLYGCPKNGVYVYPNKQDQFQHMCMVLDRFSKHGDDDVLLLRVKYKASHILSLADGSRVVLTHNGILGDSVVYHENEPIHILTRRVPRRRIEVVWRRRISDLTALDHHPDTPRICDATEFMCTFWGDFHDEAFSCDICERLVCGVCADAGDGDEWFCPECMADPLLDTSPGSTTGRRQGCR